MLQAIVSVATITGDHDGYCSSDDNEDTAGYLNYVPVRLVGDVAIRIAKLCADDSHYLIWLLDQLHFEFKTHDIGTYGSGYCNPSPSGFID